MEKMTHYTAHVTADGSGWMVTIPELDRVTYAPHLRDVKDMAVDLIQIMTDDTTITTDVLTVIWPEDIQGAISNIHKARTAAELAQQAAAKTMADNVIQLTKTGKSYRDIGAVLGISHQRVSQLATGRSGSGKASKKTSRHRLSS